MMAVNSLVFVVLITLMAAKYSPVVANEQVLDDRPDLPRWFSRLDRDGDGVLSADEAGRLLSVLDSDGDREVTAAEAAAYVRKRVEAAGRKGDRPRRGQMLVRAAELESQEKNGDGLWVVTIGHSCVVSAIEPCISVARSAGFENHTHLMQFYGGPSGAAEAQWQHEGDKQQAKAALASRKIDVMTFGHLVDWNGRSRGCDVEDYERWIDLAIEHNPKIRFYIQDLWPWLPGPERSVEMEKFTLENYEAAMEVSTRSINAVVEALNRKYPGRIHILPAGLAMTELVRRVTRDELPGVDAVLVGQKEKQHGLRVGLYRDKIHPTDLVAALQGYIYYACLYQRNPTALETALYRDEQLDKTLREVAWKVVTEHRHSSVKRH